GQQVQAHHAVPGELLGDLRELLEVPRRFGDPAGLEQLGVVHDESAVQADVEGVAAALVQGRLQHRGFEAEGVDVRVRDLPEDVLVRGRSGPAHAGHDLVGHQAAGDRGGQLLVELVPV